MRLASTRRIDFVAIAAAALQRHVACGRSKTGFFASERHLFRVYRFAHINALQHHVKTIAMRSVGAPYALALYCYRFMAYDLPTLVCTT